LPRDRRVLPSWSAPLAVALIWGVNVPVMKSALAGIGPFAFNALRLTLSALALGVVDRLEARTRPPAHAPERTPWGSVLGLALLTSFVYQLLFVTGIARTSASHAGFLIASGPLWTALLARALGVERPAPRAWLGLALAFLGTSLVAAAVGGNRAATLSGNGLVLLAMLAWAVGTVWSRGVLERFSATRLAFLSTLVALPAHWLVGWHELAPVWSGGLAAGTWLAIAYSGVFSTGVAYSLWNRSVRALGPSRTSAYTNLVPLCSLAIAWGFLGERPSLAQLTGGALILLGLASWRASRAASA